jgi:trehalose synthase
MQEVFFPSRQPSELAPVIGEARSRRFAEEMPRAALDLFGSCSVLNVNATATGGGVAEMLRVLLPYVRGVGIDARWMVLDADERFFTITKRLHNHLYGTRGDGGPLGDDEHRHYEEVLRENGAQFAASLRPCDVVILHDPQTAALAEIVRAHGAAVIWRCHVGIDEQNEESVIGWEFLRRYLEPPAVHGYVFSRREFAPSWIPDDQIRVIPPSIDPFAAKNMPLEPGDATAILTHTGLLGGPAAGTATFTRPDGSPARVERGCDIIRTGPPPDVATPLVTQVSRWDRMKDMPGVMAGFAELALAGCPAHLVLAGPVVTAVADDPEGAEVLHECWEQWRALPHAARRQIQLVCVPMADLDENAVIVNALQSHSAVVVQKSTAEGFGLTVAEAMLKGTPVVGSAVGGIVDQIVHGETGLLLTDPLDLESFGKLVETMLADDERRLAMGEAARRRAVEEFLPDRHLGQWLELLTAVRGLAASGH